MSPELENIKVETNRIPDEAFQLFVNLFRLIESHKAELAQWLLKAQKSESIPDDVLEYQQQSLMESGNAIINVYSNLIDKVLSSDIQTARCLRHIMTARHFC